MRQAHALVGGTLPAEEGTAREVGTFSHRPPADMVVTNMAHRDIAERICVTPAWALAMALVRSGIIGPGRLKKRVLVAFDLLLREYAQAETERRKDRLSRGRGKQSPQRARKMPSSVAAPVETGDRRPVREPAVWNESFFRFLFKRSCVEL